MFFWFIKLGAFKFKGFKAQTFPKNQGEPGQTRSCHQVREEAFNLNGAPQKSGHTLTLVLEPNFTAEVFAPAEADPGCGCVTSMCSCGTEFGGGLESGSQTPALPEVHAGAGPALLQISQISLLSCAVFAWKHLGQLRSNTARDTAQCAKLQWRVWKAQEWSTGKICGVCTFERTKPGAHGDVPPPWRTAVLKDWQDGWLVRFSVYKFGPGLRPHLWVQHETHAQGRSTCN